MFDAFTITCTQMIQILLFMSIGFGLNKLHIISREAEGVLSRFVSLLFIPSMTLYSNMMECKLSSLATYSSWCLYGLLFYLISLFLSFPLSKLFSRHDLYQQGVFRYALTFPNIGAIGNPLILSLFGTKGFFQYGLFTFAGNILTYIRILFKFNQKGMSVSCQNTKCSMITPISSIFISFALCWAE